MQNYYGYHAYYIPIRYSNDLAIRAISEKTPQKQCYALILKGQKTKLNLHFACLKVVDFINEKCFWQVFFFLPLKPSDIIMGKEFTVHSIRAIVVRIMTLQFANKVII